VHAGKIEAIAEQPMLQETPIFGNPISAGCRTGRGIQHPRRAPALFKNTPTEPQSFLKDQFAGVINATTHPNTLIFP